MTRTLAFYATTLYQDFKSYTAAQLKELGLNYGQLPFIIFVGKMPGCTPSQLTKQLHMDWGHSQRSLDKLVEDGFIAKRRDKPTSRICHLYLTAQGEKAFSVGHEVFFDWDKAICENLTPEQTAQLLDTLEILTQTCKKKCKNDTI